MLRFNPAVVVVVAFGVFALSTLGAQDKHWGYEDGPESVGPANWGTLEGSGTCSTGTQQTPINLSASVAAPRDLPDLVLMYQPSTLSMINNGHTVQMNYTARSRFGRAGSTDAWTLAQFHFHAPSEHTVDGTSYPLEMHLVHLDAAGEPAVVVGVFINVGVENAALARAFRSLPAKEGETIVPLGERIDPTALLPADKTFFTYAGSLTTPPCTEGITWYVLRTPIEMSSAQIDAYTTLAHLGHTNRPIQSLGGRVVLVDSTPGT